MKPQKTDSYCLWTTTISMATNSSKSSTSSSTCWRQTLYKWQNVQVHPTSFNKICSKQINLYVWYFKRQGFKILPLFGYVWLLLNTRAASVAPRWCWCSLTLDTKKPIDKDTELTSPLFEIYFPCNTTSQLRFFVINSIMIYRVFLKRCCIEATIFSIVIQAHKSPMQKK